MNSTNNIPKIILGNELSFLKYLNGILAPYSLQALEEIEKLRTKIDLFPLQVSKGKSQIGVEQVSSALAFSHQKPAMGKFAYLIVLDSAKLNDQAQNKLLKLLESPPHYLHILLLYPTNRAEPESIINTVLSRSEVIKLDREQVKPSLTSEQLSIEKFSRNFRDNYLEFRELVDKAKDNQEKHLLVAELIKSLNNNLSRRFSLSSLSHKEILETKKLMNILDEIEAANGRNANPRLLVDNLYLALKQEDPNKLDISRTEPVTTVRGKF